MRVCELVCCPLLYYVLPYVPVLQHVYHEKCTKSESGKTLSHTSDAVWGNMSPHHDPSTRSHSLSASFE